MTRTALAALALLRLSGPAVEPVLSGRDIHRTVGEPHRLRQVDARPASLRVVTWNIERGVQYDAILEALRSIDAEILLLQEVDRFCRRSGYRDVARDLAHDLGMNWVFAGEFQELGEGRRRQPATTGQAILSRYAIDDARADKFRAQDRWRWSMNPVQPRRGGRIVLTARSAGLRVYNTHAESGNNEAVRRRQLLEILEAQRREAGDLEEVVIGGDLNTSMTSGDLLQLFKRAGFTDAAKPRLGRRQPTSQDRTEPIDWLLARGFTLHDARVHETSWSVSDHRAVLVSLRRLQLRYAVPGLALDASDLDTVLAGSGLLSR
jgi:endonuclease/exonuclease/phosphatase family metal-dependent hydrolase